MSSENCQICNKAPFKYTCPRCNIVYCSLPCYKSQQHLKCSEEFYKQCVQDELSSAGGEGANNKEDMRKIYDILKRIRESDAGIEADNFDMDGLDSDDEENTHGLDCEEEDGEQGGNLEDEDDDNDEEDIAERLKDIDINDADEVWQKLTAAEKEEFKKLVSTGDIMKLMPDFKPWWLRKENSKIVVVSTNEEPEKNDVPKVVDNIAKYSSICSKEPAPCLHYNLWNILAAYSCTVRFFNGEHFTSPNEATAYLINLSSTLKYGTNFEDVEDAVISVEMEALTTGNGATQLMPTTGTPKSLLVEDRVQLKADSRQLMSTLGNKLSALSDILRLLQLTKKILKAPNKGEAEFQKLFALSSGMEELTRSKVQQLIKKLEFYLSYVNRENE
ncbi:zinc finger HIT domain-containing protein 2 [Lucilia sericata]|uniref:zinc finger HIT domain-containing protein 2 n=1 Tax=Lucilia sericata TaxID=13632 RepID=UPI0018A83CA6|nr:zinc finger HIT domain-containing protein 2 [Lucilia sericata]